MESSFSLSLSNSFFEFWKNPCLLEVSFPIWVVRVQGGRRGGQVLDELTKTKTVKVRL